MKTQHEKYLERIAHLMADMEEEAVLQFMEMFEAYALRYQKKVKLRLVVVGG